MTEARTTPAEVANTAPSWSSLITAARRLSVIHGAVTVPRHDVDGGLLFDVDATRADEDDPETVRGILAAIHAASTETCASCGGPGDPVTLQSGRRSTRCADCRGPSDLVRPRPPWRQERDPQDGRAQRAPLVENPVGLEDLEILMEARHEPGEHRTWPVTTVDRGGNQLSGVEAAGWNHLVRAALRLLLPMECPGSNPIWRLGQLKEKFGELVICHARYTPFLGGVTDGFRELSATVYWHCGRQGRRTTIDTPIQPACSRCDRRGHLRRAPSPT